MAVNEIERTTKTLQLAVHISETALSVAKSCLEEIGAMNITSASITRAYDRLMREFVDNIRSECDDFSWERFDLEIWKAPVLAEDYKDADDERLHRREFRFDNGFGASVFNTKRHPDEWQLAVLDFRTDPVGPLCYTTDITDNVLNYLTIKQVEKTLQRVRSLDAKGKE